MTFQCPTCGEVFNSKAEFIQHIANDKCGELASEQAVFDRVQSDLLEDEAESNGTGWGGDEPPPVRPRGQPTLEYYLR